MRAGLSGADPAGSSPSDSDMRHRFRDGEHREWRKSHDKVDKQGEDTSEENNYAGRYTGKLI